MKVNKYGQGGKAMAGYKLLTHCFQPTMIWIVWCNGKFVLQSINYKHVLEFWCVAKTCIPSKPIIV